MISKFFEPQSLRSNLAVVQLTDSDGDGIGCAAIIDHAINSKYANTTDFNAKHYSTYAGAAMTHVQRENISICVSDARTILLIVSDWSRDAYGIFKKVQGIAEIISNHAANNASVYIIYYDHHENATKFFFELKGLVENDHSSWCGKLNHLELHCNIDFTKSASLQMCESILSVGHVPPVMKLINDYDTWEHKMGEDTWVLNSYLTQKSVSFENKVAAVRNAILTEPVMDEIMRIGKILYAEECARIEERVETAHWLKIDYPTVEGIKQELMIPAVQSDELWSQIGHALIKRYDSTIAIVYHLKQHKHSWKFSVRSKPGAEVLAVDLAKYFGAGGHDHSAGCLVAYGQGNDIGWPEGVRAIPMK